MLHRLPGDDWQTIMRCSIRQATSQDVELVSGILQETAHWLEQKGMPLWRNNELVPARIAADVSAGLFFLAECSGEAAGTVKFQLEDSEFWPDFPQPDAAYIHRLAVRRHFAGGDVSTALMHWAVDRTRSLGRRYLRLDCATRPKLCAIYERFGFRHHSDRQVGPYFVSRYAFDVEPAS